MMNKNTAEVWLGGPLQGIPPLLQPVAHALLQAREEINELMQDFPAALLWEKPAGMASPGFHLQHMAGVLDRLFTYASGKMLSSEQLSYLSAEGKPPVETYTINTLVENFDRQVDIAIKQLSETEEATLTEVRGVGRAQTPSTIIGLVVHSAEHTMRHTGQLLVTARFLVDNM